MSIHFYLVRHGIKERAAGDVTITPEGVQQAQSTAQHFAPIPVTAVLSSPLRRAQHTAVHIAEAAHVSIRVDSRLRERANWGDLPGQSFQEFVEMWDRCTREPDYIPPVGDSSRQACQRMSSLLTDLAEEYPDGSHIVLVTHGGLITDFLVNSFPESILNEFHIHFVAEQSRLVSECSVTKLIVDNEKYDIDCFASVRHLNAEDS
ncbi:histidine phosphatase family protein [Paenibacillus lemnae]|uniref:Histidine phosphatase family protein n=1 Tax=Paenibacillus lemnae TaxID=1330551 RepID=A0A848MDA3_PAELE|nr:histidine phosphatase family protein [Paenibacillus lemnae]NMO98171.1 histidine phosphatase family protein [Paenibacillus lemnae]